MSAADLAPRPGAAPIVDRVRAQAQLEARLLLRNGEQLLLTMILPTLILIGVSRLQIGDSTPAYRIALAAPAVLGVAVMSTAFTGQAIATGFERRYGVLERLGMTPLGRGGLLAGKTTAILAVEAIQIALLSAVAVALGWRPEASPAGLVAALLLLLLGTAALSALGLLMAGTLRAEATLAAANIVWLVSVAAGGVVEPLDDGTSTTGRALELLPLGALVAGLRTAFDGTWPWLDGCVLAVWLAAAGVAAMRWFRWD